MRPLTETEAPKQQSAARPRPAAPHLHRELLPLCASEGREGSVLPSSVQPSGLPLCWDHKASIRLGSVPPWDLLGTGSRTKPTDA